MTETKDKIAGDGSNSKPLSEQVDRRDHVAQRIAGRIDNAKTVDAVPPAPLPSDKTNESMVSKNRKVSAEERAGKEHPKIDGPAKVDDPMMNDNRRWAENEVIAEHGEDIRGSGKFEELVQKKLVSL